MGKIKKVKYGGKEYNFYETGDLERIQAEQCHLVLKKIKTGEKGKLGKVRIYGH